MTTWRRSGLMRKLNTLRWRIGWSLAAIIDDD
jgi:hypothetical protein